MDDVANGDSSWAGAEGCLRVSRRSEAQETVIVPSRDLGHRADGPFPRVANWISGFSRGADAVDEAIPP